MFSGLRYLTACLLLTLVGVATAQLALPADAAEALRQGQAAAAEAMAVYQVNRPDQPLWRQAFAAGNRARQLAPGRPEPLRFLAQAYGITGWTARAWDSWMAYRAAGGAFDASARVEASAAARKLGYQAFISGDNRQAAALLGAAFELTPDDPELAALLGQAEFANGDLGAAATHLRLAVPAFPSMEPLLVRAQLGANYGLATADAYLSGTQLYAAGDRAGALQQFELALQAAPNFTDAVRGAAQSAAALGREEQARAYWSRLAQLAPGDPEAAAALERYAQLDARRAAAAQEPPRAVVPPTPTPPAPEPQPAPQPAQPQPPAPQPEPTPQPEPQPEPVPQPEPEPAPEPEPEPAPQPPPVPEPAPEPEPEPEPQPAPEPEPEPTPPPTPEPQPEPPATPEPPAEPAPRPAAPGEQIVLVDQSLTAASASEGGQGAFIFLGAPASARSNLASPLDYGNGTLYVRVQVQSRPSAQPVTLQLCVVPVDVSVVGPVCSQASRLDLPASGSVDAVASMGDMAGGLEVDWSQGVSQVLIVLRDAQGRPIDDRYTRTAEGTPLDLSPYYPLSMAVTAVLVPAGGSFTGWP